MEEESKISFWKKIKISIFGLEDYKKLATQKVVKTIGYLAKLMLIFVFIISIALTYRFSTSVGDAKNYIENELQEVHFENNVLTVVAKERSQEPIIIENEDTLNGKIIIDTGELTEEQINAYTDDVKGYTNGILILRNKIIFKTSATATYATISFADITEQYNLVKLDKQEIVDMLSSSNAWSLYLVFFITMFIYLFIIYFSSVLMDALLYSLLGYFTGILSKLRIKYSATYNIAVHALTLPIILNIIYMIVNIFTGYTIKYFDIMYMAITCIYIITAILMIKSDMIKKQMELSRIISEQEKVKQEMDRKEQERKEEEEKERIRKEDEKKRQEEKEKKEDDLEDKSKGKTDKKEKKSREPRENESPQPEANIKPSNL